MHGSALRIALFMAAAATTSIAQSVIGISTVVNAASYEPGLPDAGSLASIGCTGLEGITGVIIADGSRGLPRSLAGVSVNVNGSPAPILAVANFMQSGAFQINIQVPWAAIATWPATIVVSQGDASGVITVDHHPQTGGLFAQIGGYGAARHASDGTPVTNDHPARRGETVALLGTGFGPAYPDKPVGFETPASPEFVEQPDRALISIAGTTVPVAFQRLLPGSIGVEQIGFSVPDNAPSGVVEVLYISRTPVFPGGIQPPVVYSNRVSLPVQ